MTGPQHFKEAERLAALAVDYETQPDNHHVQLAQVAQTHALLALAAAVALKTPSRSRWGKVAGRQEKAAGAA